MKLYVIRLTDPDGSGRMDEILQDALELAEKKAEVEMIYSADDFCCAADRGLLQDSRILFAAELAECGIHLELEKVLRYLHIYRDSLEGTAGAILIDGKTDLYTKDAGRRIAFAANRAGCAFPGKALVEATGSLGNFAVLAKNWGITPREAYEKNAKHLVERLLDFRTEVRGQPSILMVHASSRKTSNSLLLWSRVAEHLEGLANVEEISIRNGQVWDCRGCKYETCLHFGENSSCFYGGVMVEKVYPAILRSDVLVLVCPNYNDAVSANIMAFINRLTAVFRTNDFSRKRVYALVVSGYSGGDIVAQQIIGAMNMNKNFILPAEFALMATANDPGSVLEIEGIEEMAEAFAERILCREK